MCARSLHALLQWYARAVLVQSKSFAGEFDAGPKPSAVRIEFVRIVKAPVGAVHHSMPSAAMSAISICRQRSLNRCDTVRLFIDF